MERQRQVEMVAGVIVSQAQRASVRFAELLFACVFLSSFVSVLHAVDDKRFTLKDGIIYDSQLRLEWAPANGKAMDHYAAEEYARNLSLAGGGWRLPTREELKSLYDPSKPGHADPVFNIDNNLVWTSEVDDLWLAWYFLFNYGLERRDTRDTCYSFFTRVLVVRSRR